jgi:hypothetical protein
MITDRTMKGQNWKKFQKRLPQSTGLSSCMAGMVCMLSCLKMFMVM